MTDHKNLASALAAFQSELPRILKDNMANVKTKSGASYSYSYADLSDISPIVLPLLGKHGLAWTTLPTLEEGSFVLKYSLVHGASGDAIKGVYPLPHQNTPHQEMGGAITFARRYALLAVTGVAPGDDAPPPAEASEPEVVMPSDWEAMIDGLASKDEGTALWGRARAEGWLTTEVQGRITQKVTALKKENTDD